MSSQSELTFCAHELPNEIVDQLNSMIKIIHDVDVLYLIGRKIRYVTVVNTDVLDGMITWLMRNITNFYACQFDLRVLINKNQNTYDVSVCYDINDLRYGWIINGDLTAFCQQLNPPVVLRPNVFKH